jgi:hypothetical protein
MPLLAVAVAGVATGLSWYIHNMDLPRFRRHGG